MNALEMSMTLPSQAVVTQLDADRRAVAHHEIGHAVTAIVIGLPVYEVWLAYHHHQQLLLSDWSVEGRTEVAPEGGTVSGTADQEILFILGGLESEAIHRERCGDGTLAACRRTVANIGVNQRGDLPQMQAALADTGATFTHHAAQQQVHEVLTRRWQVVDELAAELHEHGHLSGTTVQRHL